jgi:Domain of unknown function (DUF5664)
MFKHCTNCKHEPFKYDNGTIRVSSNCVGCSSEFIHWEPKSKTEVNFEKKESDPTGKSQHEPGAKLDDGKPPIARIKKFYLALCEIAKLDAYGAIEYSDVGWKKVPDAENRYDNAEGRHWFKEALEEKDPKSGFPHDVCTAWNAIVRLQLRLDNEKEIDSGSNNNSSLIHSSKT